MRALPERLKERLRALPNAPGVYFFRDRDRKTIYIGKALSIRKRVGGHFRNTGESNSKEGILLSQVDRVDFIETPTESDALLLEASLVKENLPKYNAMLKDDKSYPYLKITGEEYPRLLIVRERKADGSKYFGPYTDVWLLRQAVKRLRREYPLRTCRKLPKKVCLMYHIGQCGGPCEGKQDRGSYLAIVHELQKFLEGRRDALVRNLTRKMREYSSKREFEKAKIVFDEIRALSTVPSTGRGAEGATLVGAVKDAFGLPRPPARIECYDISNLFGKEAVGSMVVFGDGRPARSEYRRFRIREVAGIDDYESMREVMRRRFAKTPEEGWPAPDLVVIDGGKGHLAAAKGELDRMRVTVPILSIAKQHELVYQPGRENPYVLPPHSPALLVLRHLRDEAHRFAIQYHRKLHRKESLASLYGNLPGVGPATRAKLSKAGTPEEAIAMGAEKLARRAGLSERVAARVLDALASAGVKSQA